MGYFISYIWHLDSVAMIIDCFHGDNTFQTKFLQEDEVNMKEERKLWNYVRTKLFLAMMC